MPFPHEREEVTPNNDFLTVSDKSVQVLLVTQSFKGLFTTVRCVLNFGPISLQIVSANPNEVVLKRVTQERHVPGSLAVFETGLYEENKIVANLLTDCTKI